MGKLKWTKEKCQNEALKYSKKHDFIKGCGSAYNSAYDNGWLNDICKHMISPYKKSGFWSKEECQKESNKYLFRNDFKNGSPVAYSVSLENKWMDELCNHMEKKRKGIEYWTKEKCQEISLKYDSKTKLARNEPTLYKISLRMKWLDEICYHMKKNGNRLNKCIYAYEFSDKSVYIGLTYNVDDRCTRHKNDSGSQVFKHSLKFQSTFKTLTDYVNVNVASNLEGEFVQKYKNDGWLILNKIKTGGIGGNVIKWNKEKCQEESLKYNKRSDFAKHSPCAYSSAIKHNWLDDICIHMILSHIRKRDKEECRLNALKCKNISSFKSKYEGSYNIALKNNWLNDICGHMKNNRHWDKDKCQIEALKYNQKYDFKKSCGSAYSTAYNNGWLNEICSHMKKLKN